MGRLARNQVQKGCFFGINLGLRKIFEMAQTATLERRPLFGTIRNFWKEGGHLVLGTSKGAMASYYTGHGYPKDRIHLHDPNQYVEEPECVDALHAANAKLEALYLNLSVIKGILPEGRVATLTADVLTGISYTDPKKSDPDWQFHHQPGRQMSPNNPVDVSSLRAELVDRYAPEFWVLWMVGFMMALEHKGGMFTSLSVSLLGHFPEGIPEKVINRAVAKNPVLPFKIGPSIDLASHYRRHGDGEAECVSCKGDSGLENKPISPDGLIRLVVFRYLTQQQMSKGLLQPLER